MTVDTTAIRFRLLRSYRVGDGVINLDRALQAACQDVAVLCAEVDRLRKWATFWKWATRVFWHTLNVTVTKHQKAERQLQLLQVECTRMARMYESDCPRMQPYNVVGVPQESIREAQRLRESE